MSTSAKYDPNNYEGEEISPAFKVKSIILQKDKKIEVD